MGELHYFGQTAEAMLSYFPFFRPSSTSRRMASGLAGRSSCFRRQSSNPLAIPGWMRTPTSSPAFTLTRVDLAMYLCRFTGLAKRKDGMMDKDRIDQSAHELEQMVSVLTTSIQNLKTLRFSRCRPMTPTCLGSVSLTSSCALKRSRR
jgi:hypothetical protein